MKNKTSVELHLEKLNESLDFRAEYSLLELAESIASQIKRIRERKGWSQAELASKLQTKQSQISRLENPEYSRYSLLTLAKVADLFGCKLDVTLTEEVSSNICYFPSPESNKARYKTAESGIRTETVTMRKEAEEDLSA